MAQPSAQTNGARTRRATHKSPDRTLPHNDEAEASILGGIILHNELLGELDTLETGHFYNLKNQVVFEAMRNLEAAGKPIDVVTLETEIHKRGRLEAFGGNAAYFAELALKVPTTENVYEYAKIVRETALIRNVILIASEKAERGYSWQYEADEFLGEMLAELQKLDRGHREANEKLPVITIGQSLEEIDRLAKTPVYDTPHDELNEALGFGGMLAGQVYYLNGGTGFGKTSFIGGLAKHQAMQQRPVLIAFWEMFAGYYTARMAAPLIGCHSNDILRARRAPSEVMRALPTMIEFLDSPSMSVLRRAAERHIRAGRSAPLIIIDYIQLLGDQILATMPRPDARLANAQASAQLRALAKETGSAVVAVSAAGRSASKTLGGDVRKRPPRELIDSARESGAIEYDGAGVIVLSVSDEKDGDESIATVSIAKARFGQAVHLDARYDGRTGGWRVLGVAEREFPTTKPNESTTTKPAKTPLDELLLKLLKNGPIASKSALWRLSGRHKQTVFEEIDRMVKKGIIRYAAKGIEISEITTSGSTGSGTDEPSPEPQGGLL